MEFPIKGIAWTTFATDTPLEDFKAVRELGRKQSVKYPTHGKLQQQYLDKLEKLIMKEISKEVGLINRYTITHKDGKPIDPNKQYLVIDLTDPDPREFEAALQFARICIMTGYENLGADIIRKLYSDYKADWYVETEMIEDLGPYHEKIAKQMEKEIDEQHRYSMCYINSTSFSAEQFIKDLLEI